MIMKTMKQVNLVFKRISFLPFLLALCLVLCSCGMLPEPQDAAADTAEPIAPAETQPAPDIAEPSGTVPDLILPDALKTIITPKEDAWEYSQCPLDGRYQDRLVTYIVEEHFPADGPGGTPRVETREVLYRHHEHP